MATLRPLPEPAGFPNCASRDDEGNRQTCPYLNSGSPQFCSACAAKTIELVPDPSCPKCSQALDSWAWSPDQPPLVQPCRNKLCRLPDRRIGPIRAVAMDTGPLNEKLRAYKYDGKTGWGTIFGRLLVGWLDANMADERPDLIVANPSFPDPARPLRHHHTEAVIAAAAQEDTFGEWAFDVGEPRLIVMTAPAPQSAGKTWDIKWEAAQAHIPLWQLTDPAAIVGKRILVFDDLCTTGAQLETLARYLLDRGAAEVSAVVLARAKWR